VRVSEARRGCDPVVRRAGRRSRQLPGEGGRACRARLFDHL